MEDRRWAEGALLGAALVFLVFLILGLAEILNPLLVFLALLGVLLPLRDRPIFWPVVGTAGGLTTFWLLSEMGFVLAPFVLAIVAAYILNPVVSWLAGRRPLRRLAGEEGTGRGGRVGAVLLLGLPVVGGLVALGLWGVPWVAHEISALSRRAPEVLERLAGMLEGVEEFLLRLQLPGFDGSEWAARVAEVEGDDIVGVLEERWEQIVEWLLTGALGLGRGVGAFLSILGYLVLAPVIAFYLLTDWDRVVARASELIPDSRTELRTFFREYDAGLSAYLRGQVLVSLTVGAMTALGLLLVGFPFAIFLGAVVAVFNVVPYLGLVLSLLPAIGIALTTGTPGVSLLKVAVVYTIAQSLESGVISPRIVGDSTGLHPVWILLAIMVSGFFFGFVGLLIAVPAAVGLKLLVIRGVDRYRESRLFRGGPDGEVEPS